MFLPQSFDFHHITTHIYILPITPRFHPFPTLHFTILPFTSLHFTTLFYTFRWFSFHFTSLHFTSLHFTSLHYTFHIHIYNLACSCYKAFHWKRQQISCFIELTAAKRRSKYCFFHQKSSHRNCVSVRWATLAVLLIYCKRVVSVIDGEWLPRGKTRPATRYIVRPKT